MVPVLLVVARAVLRRAGEVRDLVGRVAVIAEKFVGEQEDLPLRLLRELAHLPLCETEPERRPLVKRELIAGDMVRMERDGLLKSLFPDLERLAGQAIDQIDRNRVEPRRAGGLHALARLRRRMPASQEFQSVRVEGLNPQGEKADVESPPGLYTLGVDILGIRLERDPCAVLDRKVFAGGSKDARDIVRRESGRSAAAEIDRVDPLGGRAVRSPESDLRNQMIGELPPPLRPAGQDREIAVGTDGGTEGDVEIETGVGFRELHVGWTLDKPIRADPSNSRTLGSDVRQQSRGWLQARFYRRRCTENR